MKALTLKALLATTKAQIKKIPRSKGRSFIGNYSATNESTCARITLEEKK